MQQLTCRPIAENDIPLLTTWLNKPYILKWYENPEDWLLEIRERNTTFQFVKHFIVLDGQLPIGFFQYYPCEQAKEAWYGNLPLAGTYSIDYLIGQEDYLGKGYGSTMIALITDAVFSLPDAARVIVQPDADNSPSCNSLLSNGYLFDNENALYCKTKP